jgi:hypothetical protein
MRLAVALVAVALPSVALARPSTQQAKTLASYCSSSGDICYGLIRRAGVVRAEITTAAHYFNRYTLCVKPAGTGGAGLLRCGSFPVFRQGGAMWGSSVRLARQFPLVESGIVRVTWKLASGPLGPTLRFRFR